MTRTMLDRFLEKLAQSPDLQREFVDLAARHGINFSAPELGDRELDGVAGGAMPDPIPHEQMLSNISRMLHNTAMSTLARLR
jgi:hypothetical protein